MSVKNTTFLIVLAVLAGCGVLLGVRMVRNSSALRSILVVLVAVPLILTALAAVVYAWWQHREVLPTGNVEYRVEMNRIAWRLFLDSPLWGKAFTDPSIFYFSLYRVEMATQYLPTHNDVLDLLAHGGVIAFALWAVTMWRLTRIGSDAARRLAVSTDTISVLWRWVFVLALVQLGAVITCLFNPILISPLHSFWLWGSAGVMWALHSELTAKPLPSRMTYSKWLAKASVA